MDDPLDDRLRDVANRLVAEAPSPPAFDEVTRARVDGDGPPDQGHRARSFRVAAAVAAAIAVLCGLLVVVRASSRGTVTAGDGSVASLASKTTDGCGNDLGALHSTAIGVDAVTGSTRWRRDDLPVVAAGTVIGRDGRLWLEVMPGRGALALDPRTGVTSGSDEQAAPATVSTVMPGAEPAAYNVVGDALEAVDATGARLWVVSLVGRSGGRSAPIEVGGVVAVVTSDRTPTCA